MNVRSNRKPAKKRNLLFLIPVLLAAFVLAGVLFVKYTFAITEVTITGSEKYSYEELYDYIFQDRNDSNILLYLYTDSKADPVSIPFIAKTDVEIIWPNKINVTVYEKSLIGYVTYMGSYMYFDKDGVVAESSSELIDDVPHVSGLDFSDIVLYEPLDVGDPSVFSEIQNLTQYLEKYEIDVDEIMISDNMTFSIQIDNVKVLLGNEETTFSEKAYELSAMLPKLEGLSGTLDMEKYNGDSSFITFASDVEETEEETETETETDAQAVEE